MFESKDTEFQIVEKLRRLTIVKNDLGDNPLNCDFFGHFKEIPSYDIDINLRTPLMNDRAKDLFSLFDPNSESM